MNMPCAGILSLPLELLDEIIAYVAISAPGVLNLRCVNKTLCSLTTPTAFRKIVVHATERSTQGFLELLVSTDIARHVRVIKFIEDLDPTGIYLRSIVYSKIYSEESSRFEKVRNHLREAFSRLHLVPSLESLVITFLIDDDADSDALSLPHLLQIDVLGGLACNPNPLPALQSLHIHGWLALIDDLYSEAPFKRIVESLRNLHFTVQHHSVDSDESDDPSDSASTPRYFWTNVVGLRVLRPAVNLTSLAMDSYLAFGFVIPINLDSITYPCLTSLTLSRFSWYESLPKVTLQVEEFIVRHGKTLKQLALYSCTIPIPGKRSAPVRPWTAVWNRFAEELTELVDLDVYWELCEYIEDGLEGDFANYDVPGTEQDSPALKALETIVKGRKRLTYCAGDWASGV